MSQLSSETESKKKRGEYAVSPRLQRALAAYASGAAKTQEEAAAVGGLSLRALQRGLKRQNVREHIQAMVRETLTSAAPRAAHRMTELLASSNEMVGFRASQFVLATGAGTVMPNANSPGVNVNVSNTTQVGFLIDLRPPAEKGEPISEEDLAALSPVGGVLLGSRRDAPAVIEGTTADVTTGSDERAR